MVTTTKSCFFISPIGEDGSEQRRLSDKVREFMSHQVLEGLGYRIRRADDINKVGKITEDIIREIINSNLVVALLDYENPNVYYELALRHATFKICLSIASRETVAKLPFDMSQERVFKFPMKDMLEYRSSSMLSGELDRFKNQIIDCLREYEEQQYPINNPITSASKRIMLPQDTSIDNILDHISDSINTVRAETATDIARLESGMTQQITQIGSMIREWMPEELRSVVNDMYQNGSAIYISGEDEAFAKLTEMTKGARHSLRTSRFAPQAISTKHSDFYNAVCDFGRRQGVVCKRLMCLNAEEKKMDILKTVMDTCGGSMRLYLTQREYDNNFEIVVIDHTCAFLHFYDDKRYIKSTLFIRGQSVVEEFEKIYDRFTEPDEPTRLQQIRMIDCSQYDSPAAIFEYAQKCIAELESTQEG